VQAVLLNWDSCKAVPVRAAKVLQQWIPCVDEGNQKFQVASICYHRLCCIIIVPGNGCQLVVAIFTRKKEDQCAEK